MMQVLLAVLKMLNIVTKWTSNFTHRYISKRNENKAFPGGPWLRFHTPSTGCLSLIPGQERRPHMPRQRLKIPCAASETQSSQTKQKAKVEFTCCKVKSIRVKTPVALSSFTVLGNYHLHLVLKGFSTPKRR